jgi:hypothetical protein
MKKHPPHIWVIACIYFLASVLAVYHDWSASKSSFSKHPFEGLLVLLFDLYPAFLGLLLTRGERMSRWLFIPLIPLVAAYGLLVSFGNAMRGAPKQTPELVWIWGFFFISIVSTMAVFAYFAKDETADV